MVNQFTTVTNRGCLSNIFGSFVGFIAGPILVIGAVVLLSWNEGRAVQAISGLGEAGGQVVEATTAAVDPGKEGKLVHVTGPVTAAAPLSDPDVQVPFAGQVVVSRTVQMYQWVEKTESKTRDKLGGGTETVTTYTYSMAWSDQANDSSRFEHPENHVNPPMPFGAARWTASDARLGAYTMDDQTLRLAAVETPLRPDAPQGWTLTGGSLLKGDPASPKVGDLRVTYVGLPSGTTVSVLAAQTHGGFGSFTTRNGYQLEMVDMGSQPAATMLNEKKQSEGAMTWVLRVVGFMGIFMGVGMFLGPLSAIAAVIPLLGSITRGAAFLAALVVAVPTTLTVVALSWIVFRPLVGIGLLVAAGALLYGLHRWHQKQHPVAAAGAPPAAPPAAPPSAPPVA